MRSPCLAQRWPTPSALAHEQGSDEGRFPAEQRPFTCFRAPIRELIKARIWAGVHFRTADVQGAVLGRKVVRYMRNNYFQPLG